MKLICRYYKSLFLSFLITNITYYFFNNETVLNIRTKITVNKGNAIPRLAFALNKNIPHTIRTKMNKIATQIYAYFKKFDPTLFKPSLYV